MAEIGTQTQRKLEEVEKIVFDSLTEGFLSKRQASLDWHSERGIKGVTFASGIDALRELLDQENLNAYNAWTPNLRRSLASWFLERYPQELKLWVSDTGSLISFGALDPKDAKQRRVILFRGTAQGLINIAKRMGDNG